MTTEEYKEEYKKILAAVPDTAIASEELDGIKSELGTYEDKVKNYGDYNGTYSQQIDNEVSNYLGRDKFNFNPNNSSTYQQLRDEYLKGGKVAMQDTLASGAMLTGGNNNSAAQVAAQQVYNNYAKEVTDAIPTLEAQAYERYQNEGADMLNRIGLLQELDNAEYSRYQDEYNRAAGFLDYLNSKYQNVANLTAQELQMELSKWSTQAGLAQGDTQFAESMAYTEQADAQAQSNTDREYYSNLGMYKMDTLLIVPNEAELNALGITEAEAAERVEKNKADAAAATAAAAATTSSSSSDDIDDENTGLSDEDNYSYYKEIKAVGEKDGWTAALNLLNDEADFKGLSQEQYDELVAFIESKIMVPVTLTQPAVSSNAGLYEFLKEYPLN